MGGESGGENDVGRGVLCGRQFKDPGRGRTCGEDKGKAAKGKLGNRTDAKEQFDRTTKRKKKKGKEKEFILSQRSNVGIALTREGEFKCKRGEGESQT